LNPTNQGYNFEWEQPDEDLIPNINKVFKCLTPKGVIYSGKKYEMVFTYTPNSLGKHEAFFNFKIPSENQIHKFALHGITREPMILFNVGKVTFDPLLLGGRQKETIEIRNEEHIPYKFTFDKDSIKGNVQYGDSLFVTPIAGTLPAKSSTKVDITFMPRVEKEFNYNLQLKVKQRLKPLTLNVKGVGYTINHGVYLDNKPEMKLLRKGEHVIDFGDFFINDKRERSIRIENGGKFNFHFSFKKNGADYLKITPDSGTVTKGSKLNVTLTLFPLNKINLQNHKIFLNIASGPTYTFLINAKARSPQIIFSSIKCDFGPCYVMRQPVPNTQIITVKNMDKEALTIETDFDNKNKQYLDVFLSTGQVILPYQSQSDILEIPIQFIPRDYVKYKDIIKFKFNDIYNVDVEITGEGIPLKVELEDPSLNTLNFNIVKLGKQKKMSFNVINRGKMMTTVELYPETPNTFLKRCLSIKTDFVNDHPDEATKPLIHVLKPKEMFKIEVLFNPNLRIPQFTEDLMMKINNSEKKRLLGITGASYGVDVKMMG
jgi:hydrocephalus-inducing protein